MVPFADLCPTVRAKPVGLPLRFDSGGITRIQVLHSSSATPATWSRLSTGPTRLLIRPIQAKPEPMDLLVLIAKAADVCLKPWSHAVLLDPSCG